MTVCSQLARMSALAPVPLCVAARLNASLDENFVRNIVDYNGGLFCRVACKTVGRLIHSMLGR